MKSLKQVACTLLIASVSMQLSANESHHSSDHATRHNAAIFVGATHADDETHSTFGLEYEYRLNQNWGTGFVYESTPDAHHEEGTEIGAAMLYYHPAHSKVRLGAGIGKEYVGGEHAHSESLFRVSAGYDFHVGKITLEPSILIDHIDGHNAYGGGVALGIPF